MSNNITSPKNEEFNTYFQKHFKKGSLTIVGARPGIGRLKWMLDNSITSQMNQSETSFLTFDLPIDTLIQRLEIVYKNNPQIVESSKNLYMKEMLNPKISDIELFIKQRKNSGGLDILYIEILELIMSEEGHPLSSVSDFDKVIKNLHRLSVEHNIAIVIGKQLNRRVEYRDNKRPTLDDFAVKKNRLPLIENLIGLYRDEVYDLHSKEPNTIESIVLKSQLNNGMPFTIRSPFLLKE